MYIRTRHSSSAVNVGLGDRLFPGRHERADFHGTETTDAIAVSFTARDAGCRVDAAVTMCDELTGCELFASTADASDFFRAGAAGFSPTRRCDRLDGIELHTTAWRIHAADIHHVRSSFFDDREAFPAGSIHLDSALVMRDVEVEWQSLGSLSPGQGRPSLVSA